MARTSAPAERVTAPALLFAQLATWVLSALGTVSAFASSGRDEFFPHDPLVDRRAS